MIIVFVSLPGKNARESFIEIFAKYLKQIVLIYLAIAEKCVGLTLSFFNQNHTK
jgi:hypothetical protein